jgi:uncharacterized protein (TIGR03437 family)
MQLRIWMMFGLMLSPMPAGADSGKGPVVVRAQLVPDPPGGVTGVAVDNSGNGYLIGRIGGLFGRAFVAKASTTKKEWSVRLGTDDNDNANAVAVDAAGNVFIVGTTQSAEFPTLNAFQPKLAGGSCTPPFISLPCPDAFLIKLNPEGKMLFATFIGGTGSDRAISVSSDREGNAYVTGVTGSDNFPLAGALQGRRRGLDDAFVVKVSPSGSLIYSTYLGGSGEDFARGITADDEGNAYVTGWTSSNDFPLANAIQPVLHGPVDAFVAKFSPSGQLLSSSYFGGQGVDQGWAIALDGEKNIYLTGVTASSDFPTRNPSQPDFRGGYSGSSSNALFLGGFGDAFVTKIDPAGVLVYSTFLGGAGGDVPTAIAVDSQGRAYVTGVTNSADFPLKDPVQPEFASTCKEQERTYNFYTCVEASDGFVAALSSDGSALLLSTYAECWWCDGLYATRDSAGKVYVGGGYMFDAYQTPPFLAMMDAGARPSVAENSAANGASFLPGAVAPGEIITISGTGIGGFLPRRIPWDSADPRTSIAGVKVLFDGIAAPLIEISANSVTAVVPYSVAGQSNTEVQVNARGLLSDVLNFAVTDAAPGIFTTYLNSGVPGQGLDRAFAYNENGKQNTSIEPASRGSVVTFFATGEGQTDPPGIDGKVPAGGPPRPVLPVRVLIGGAEAEILYAGGAPGFIAGFMQINARVPDGIAPGNSVPIQIVIGDKASQPGLSIAVR